MNTIEYLKHGNPFSYIQRMMSEAQNMTRFARKPSYEEALKQAGERVERQKDISTTVHNDNTWVAGKHGKKKNPELQEHNAEALRRGAAERRIWRQEHPYLAFAGDALTAAPLAVAAYPFVAGAGEALAGTAAGQAATSGLTWLANAAKATPWVAKSLPWIDAGLTSYFAAHGLDHAINEGIHGPEDAIMTGLEVTPLGRLAKPMWNAGKEGLQYTAKAADNAVRNISPSYDLYRTIGETTPRTTPTYHGFRLNGEQAYTGSPLFEFGQTMRSSPEKAYFMRAPKDIDVLKLGNGKFRQEVVGNEILPSGEVNGKFVSYGEPWKEFALGNNSALYEFPVGPRRGPGLMATDWKGRHQKYSVDEIYDYMQKEEALNKEFRKDVTELGLDKLKGAERVKAYRALKEEKYPELLEYYDTSIHGANQTVVPNERWNFDKFLKTPFWKYSENPISGQVQKELMMRWPEAKPLETPTIEWAEAVKSPQITVENVANTTPEINKTVINNSQKIPALSLEEINKAFELARNWHINRISSPSYRNKALRAGFTEEEIPLLQQQLISLIKRLKLLSPKEFLGKNASVRNNFNGKTNAGYWKGLDNKGYLLLGIEFTNPNMSYDDAVSTFVHEFGHGATFGLNGTETSGYMKDLADQFPLINRVVKYNRTLYPEISARRVELAVPSAARTGNINYYASPTEMLSRGYEFIRDYGINWTKANRAGKLSSTTHKDLVGNRRNSNIFNTIATPKGAINFLKNALGISIPIGIGYDLYNNLSQNEIR